MKFDGVQEQDVDGLLMDVPILWIIHNSHGPLSYALKERFSDHVIAFGYDFGKGYLEEFEIG